MTDFLKDKSIKFLNKDFDGFKRDLIKYTQAHFSGVFQDFNETSPGMAVLEQAAYVGDVLSFYMDQSFNELKVDFARQEKNVVAFAKARGYRAKGKRAARGTAAFMIEVPAATNFSGETIPDGTFAATLRIGAKIGGPAGVTFETLDNIVFSSSLGREITGSRFDSTTGLPTFFALRKFVDIVAGETKQDIVVLTDFEKHRSVELSEEDVIEVLSVSDTDGNSWEEVDFLAQDTIFDADVNTRDDNDAVPFVLKLKTVPRRFITERDPETNKTTLTFGSGDGVNFDDELLPNLADLAIPLKGRETFTSFAVDPQNFLKTRSLGLSPFDTTLTIDYRIGGGPETTVPAGGINTVAEAVLDFSSTGLDAAKRSDVEGSVEVINLKKTDGGGPVETISEIKANSAAFFAAQQRMVTREDFIARVLTLPEKFGKPDKVFVKRNNVNSLALDIHVLTRDSNEHLDIPSATLKKNIKTYISPFRMITDGINILDGSIINFRVNFGVVVSPQFNRSEVLGKCLSVIRDYFDVDIIQIGQPIVISDLSADIQNVLGVISVFELKFTNLAGTIDGFGYSTTRFDIQASTANNIVYAPQDAIFELKFPQRDIVGVGK